MIFNKIQKRYVNLALVGGILLASGCNAEYNRIEQTDPNPRSSHVYGDLDGPARQTLNEYPTNPEDNARANRIREQWFGNVTGVGPTRADTVGGQTANEPLGGTTVLGTDDSDGADADGADGTN
jgi:hypothetical protein